MKPTERVPSFSASRLEPGRCPLCGQSPQRIDFRFEAFSYGACEAHNLLIQHPRPNREAMWEAYGHYFDADENQEDWETSMLPVYREMTGFLHQMRNGGSRERRVLDVGCGQGGLLKHLDRAGFRAEGQEIQAPDRAPGFPVHESSLETLARSGRRYHALTAVYVLEHVHDPLTFLSNCRQLLLPDGVLILRIPRTRSLLFLDHLTGGALNLLHVPWHLYDFTLPVLDELLERVGFQRIGTGSAQTLSRDRLEAVVSLVTRGFDLACRTLMGRSFPFTSLTVVARC